MPALTAALNEQSQTGTKKQYLITDWTTPGLPATLIWDTSIPTGNQKYQRSTLGLSFATLDLADAELLVERDSVTLAYTTVASGSAARKNQMLAMLRDVVQSDEFAAAVLDGLPIV